VFAEGQAEQTLDDLFFEYSRLVEEIQPKVFIAENVKGLVSGVAKGYYKSIIQELKYKGYVVKAKLINAKYLGVPQARERVIIIGIRNDVYWPAMEKLIFPRPLGNVISVMDSMLGLPREDTSHKKFLKRNSPRYILHQMTKRGESFDIANFKLNGKKSGFTAIKVHPYKPCPTITATPNLFHWKEPRYLSIQEITRLMGLPDDYKNTGTFYQQWARIGYMVPPPMIYYISKHLYEHILTFRQEIKI
jgi:DNA (cytosine-5)-methyltransferase 1